MTRRSCSKFFTLPLAGTSIALQRLWNDGSYASDSGCRSHHQGLHPQLLRDFAPSEYQLVVGVPSAKVWSLFAEVAVSVFSAAHTPPLEYNIIANQTNQIACDLGVALHVIESNSTLRVNLHPRRHARSTTQFAAR